jgi:HAD superfamily hydrolase (TIGR01509 family)
MNVGAIFDWDGVLIDSSAYHEASWERLAKERGLPLPEGHFKRGFGMKNEVVIPKILQWGDQPELVQELSLRKEALYREIILERGISTLPGAREWLEQLRENGVPCIIGSSTHRLNIEVTLQVLGLKEFFVSIVSAEDVSHGKPDPEVFLVAASRIDRPPAQCVVFEDALVGIEAAHRGGMKVVAVASTNPFEALKDADIVVHRLDELSVPQLEKLVA